MSLLSDARSADAAKAGRDLLQAQFAARTGVGVEMAIRSAGALANADEIAASCQALAGDLLAALKGLTAVACRERYNPAFARSRRSAAPS